MLYAFLSLLWLLGFFMYWNHPGTQFRVQEFQGWGFVAIVFVVLIGWPILFVVNLIEELF